MESFLFTLNGVLPVFLVIAAGILFKKLRLIDDKFSDASSGLVFMVALPALLFMNIAESDFTGIFSSGLLRAVIIAVSFTLIVFIILMVSCRYLISDEKERGAFVQGAFRGNYALIGVPLVYNIAGDEGVVAASLIAAFIVPLYNILAVIALSVHRKTSPKLMALMMAKNPLILASLAGIVFSASGLKLPELLSKTIGSFSVIAIPLALLSIGAFFDFRRFLSGIRMSILATALKTLVIPAVLTPAAYMLGVRGVYLVALFILFGAPTAISSYIMAKGMGSDEETAAGIIILSTAVSMFTIFTGIYIMKSAGLI